MNDLTVDAKIRMARAKAELSLDQMAHSISLITDTTISRETVRRWEKNRSSPDLATLQAISQVSGLSYGWLVGVSPNCVDPGSSNPAEDNPITARVNSMTDAEYARAVFRDRPRIPRPVGSISKDHIYVELRQPAVA